MRVVIDTNCLLVSISPFSKYHWLFESIINENITLFVTNEILEEYSEIFGDKLSIDIANKAIKTLLELPNVKPVHIHYHFSLIYADPDDNKFVDCAIAANVDYLVTNDKHFNVLKDIPFPKINIVRLEEFDIILKADL
jgi:putative PIN family toxin of toxin-antitoxin system